MTSMGSPKWFLSRRLACAAAGLLVFLGTATLALQVHYISSENKDAFPVASDLCDMDVAMSEVVDNLVAKNKVAVFGKAFCRQCRKAVDILSKHDLQSLHVEWIDRRSLSDMQDMQKYLQKLTGDKAILRVFIGGKYFGNADALEAAEENGSLAKILEQKNATGVDTERVNKEVDEAIVKYKVVLFGKTICPYCQRAVAALREFNINSFQVMWIDDNRKDETKAIEKHLERLTGSTKFPKIFVSGKLFGGCEEVEEADANGSLETILREAGALSTDEGAMRRQIDYLIAHGRVVIFGKSTDPNTKHAKDVLNRYNLKGIDMRWLDKLPAADMVVSQNYLHRITGARTMPRVFIGGKFFGGDKEIVSADVSGRLQRVLESAKALSAKGSAARRKVDDIVMSNEVVIFSKADCPFCVEAADILAMYPIKKVHVEWIDVLPAGEMKLVQNYLHQLTGARTVPRVFVKGEFFGDCEVLREAHGDGTLATALANARVLKEMEIDSLAEAAEDPPVEIKKADVGTIVPAEIDQAIAKHKVAFFGKTTCPFSRKAIKVLETYHITDLYVEWIDQMPKLKMLAIQDYMAKKTGARTVPRVFIGGEFFGGGDQVVASDRNGSLEASLKAVGALPEDVGGRQSGSVEQEVDDEIKNSKVTVFGKTFCPFTKKAVKILKSFHPDGLNIEWIDQMPKLKMLAIQDYMAKKTGARTVPRVFIGGEFFGGGDQVEEGLESGTLREALVKADAISPDN